MLLRFRVFTSNGGGDVVGNVDIDVVGFVVIVIIAFILLLVVSLWLIAASKCLLSDHASKRNFLTYPA